MTWVLFVFYDKEHKDLIKFGEFNTIKEVAYLVDLKPSVVSNYYHTLIKPRKLLEYCKLFHIIET